MSADFFLGGGLLLSLLWHLFSLLVIWSEWKSGLVATYSNENLFLLALNVGLSGVAFCGFGYLFFSQ